MRRTRQFPYPQELNTAMSRVLRARINSRAVATTAADCQRDLEAKYPALCARYGVSSDALLAAFRSALASKFGDG